MSATAQTGYFFMPEHIILVGASERPHSLGERIFSHLLGSSYQGKITPVNLRHSSVAGIPSYSSLSKIPGQADLVVAVIPPDHYDSLFKACRKKDLSHIILIQDWENLPPESCKNARSIIQKHHGDELNITVCNSRHPTPLTQSQHRHPNRLSGRPYCPTDRPQHRQPQH